MQKLNYSKLMADKPTVIATFKNRIGQEFEFVEHPIRGDAYPIIIVSHNQKIAVCSDFFEVGDMIQDEIDYHPVYIGGEIKMGYDSNYDIQIGLREAFSKRDGKLKAKCPPMNTYGAAVWQGIIGHVNAFKIGIGHMLFMDSEKQAITSLVDKKLKDVESITYDNLVKIFEQ